MCPRGESQEDVGIMNTRVGCLSPEFTDTLVSSVL